MAVKVEEWKTRFSILHYLLGEVLVLQKKDKTTIRPHPEPDWTGLPVQSIRIMVMMRRRKKRVTNMMVLVDLMMIMLMMMVMMMMTKGEGGLDEQFGSGPRQLGHPSSCASLAYDEEKMNKM